VVEDLSRRDQMIRAEGQAECRIFARICVLPGFNEFVEFFLQKSL
jgi:hypothetical protein